MADDAAEMAEEPWAKNTENNQKNKKAQTSPISPGKVVELCLETAR